MVCRVRSIRWTAPLAVALLLAPALVVAVTAPASAALDANGDGVVVVAVVDTGVNPYHRDFAAPGLTAHPSTLIPGYPADATALDLSLSSTSYSAARDADAATFENVVKGRLYFVPGTKIVGAYSADGEAANTAADVLPILDDDGHGTAAASLAVGNEHGACALCLLVVVEGWNGLEWATQQRWIDVVSNSWGTIGNAGVPVRGWGFENDWTHRAAEVGQTILFASGNGVENGYVTPEQTYASNTNGPDWVVNVGATMGEDDSRRAVLGTGRPVDLVAEGWRALAAEAASLDGETTFSGTSAATPIAAGAFAEALRQVRDEIGDPRTGQRHTGARWAVAEGTPVGSGALREGVLTRAELWDAVYRAATPSTSGHVGLYPATAPHTGVGLTDALAQGYGVVDASTGPRAAAHLLGRETLPPRDDVEFFFEWDGYVRDLLWGPWDRDGDGLREIRVAPRVMLP